MDSPLEPGPLHREAPAGAWRLPLLIAAVVGLGVVGGIVWLGRPGPGPSAPVPAELPPLNPETQAYLSQIELGGLGLSRWQNFLGMQVTYLDLRVVNHGPRAVVALELTIEFLDPFQRVVLRETLRPLEGSRPSPLGQPAGPLGPGESRGVRASFEHIPADWDGRPPRVRVTGLLLR